MGEAAADTHRFRNPPQKRKGQVVFFPPLLKSILLRKWSLIVIVSRECRFRGRRRRLLARTKNGVDNAKAEARKREGRKTLNCPSHAGSEPPDGCRRSDTHQQRFCVVAREKERERERKNEKSREGEMHQHAHNREDVFGRHGGGEEKGGHMASWLG